MSIFPLTIFPEGGLVSSVITTVWVGVFVLCFFNLRFGWVLSGLVVPGYLVPLLIVKPVSALVIVVEAILTYAIVWLFSERISRGRFPALFGRDRFMGLVLVSIAVRLSLDGYLLPLLADWLETNFDRHFDWQSNLQSFGLVIVSLLANQFWKPGLKRGLFAAVVTTGITFVLIRYGLMELTNFRISGVTYLYEGLASSILASPKAYIILVLTAMIASQMNVKYGWDFSGILIPALIALQWYQPLKIVSSALEAIAIYALASLVLKLPFMANATIEGGRKLLLFFNVSFAWKMALGWFVVWQGIGVKTTDFYGFGYLLSTLIAIKAHDKNIFPRLARSTLQVSLAGAVLGNLVGFGLATMMAVLTDERSTARAAEVTDSEKRVNALVSAAVGDAQVRRASGAKNALGSAAAAELAELVAALEAMPPEGSGIFALQTRHWNVERLGNGSIALTRADRGGRELLLYDPAASRDLAIVVNDPSAAPGLGIAALALHQAEDARWLVVDTPSPPTALQRSSLTAIFSGASTLPEMRLESAPAADRSAAAFANGAAAATDMPALRQLVPDAAISLDPDNAEVEGDRATLALTPRAIESIAARAVPFSPQAATYPCRIPPARKVKDGWDQTSRLAFLRYEIAAPLIADITDGRTPFTAHASAQLAGFALHPCQIAGEAHYLLYSPERDEGVFLLRAAGPITRSVIAYRVDGDPLASRVGASIYRRWDADNLLIAPFTDNARRSARTSFDVVWQEILRAQEAYLATGTEPQTLQLRMRPSITPEYRGTSDIVLTADRVGGEDEVLAELQSVIREVGLRTEVSDPSMRFAGFEPRPGKTSRYLGQTSGRRLTTGWLLLDRRTAL